MIINESNAMAILILINNVIILMKSINGNVNNNGIIKW